MSDDEAAPSFDDASKEASYWRLKAQDYQDMLREAEASLKDFSESSKELEQEMERELAQSAKDLDDARAKNEKLSQDKDEWKSKYTKSLTEHNKTLNEMSRELAQLRESHNIYKNKLRDMELDNDELENAERMVRSSLNDIEQRYNQQMEKATLLEQEVIDKAHLEEENQRLRDEIRDLNEEFAVLREREAMLSAAQSRNASASTEPPRGTMKLHEGREKELTLSDLTPSRPHSVASAGSKERSPSKSKPPQARVSLVPRKSLATPRDFGRTITNERNESPAVRNRRAELAASTARRGATTPRLRTQATSGTSMRMMRDLLGNMSALQTRIQRATTVGPAPVSADPDRSALPRPSSRLGSSISAGGSSPVTAGTPHSRPRPSFDGRSSIPVASAGLNRSIRRPTSRISMAPKVHGSSSSAAEGDDDESPQRLPGYIPARSMTPTAYTARARAHPTSTTSSTLSRGAGGASSPLDFLNSEPEARPSSRGTFQARDSLARSRRPGEAGSHRRGNSIQVDGSSTDERDLLGRSASATGRPRGSTISSNTTTIPGLPATSYAPSNRFTPSTGRPATSRAAPSLTSEHPPSETGSSLSSSLAAFRQRQASHARPSSAAGRRPASGITSAGGPPPPSWKKKHDPLVALEGAKSLRRSRSSSVGSETERY